MRRKRLFYVPGLVSLLLLPLLLIIFWPEVKEPPVCLRFFVPKEDTILHQAIQNKQIIKVNLWDGLHFSSWSHHKAKLIFIEQEIARLQFTNDTTQVLQIELGDENTYGDFIYLVNLAILYNVRRYTWVDNSFYIFANDPPSPPFYLTLDEIPHHLVVENTPSRWETFLSHMRYHLTITGILLKHNYLILSGFVLLIIAPGIMRIIKKQR